MQEIAKKNTKKVEECAKFRRNDNFHANSQQNR